ncbi:MAG: hypothetical protein U0641_05105 [Anaerolineae bacterium]
MSVPDTQTHLLIDTWYHCRAVRRTAQRRGWDVSGGLKSNRTLRLIADDGTRRWLKLSEYAASLSRQEWRATTWPTQHGSYTVYVHAVSTWVRKLGPTHVLLTRLSLDAPLAQTRYWGSTLLDADAQRVINALAMRWGVEVLFEDSKDLSDHYQLMSATAIVRFWTSSGPPSRPLTPTPPSRGAMRDGLSKLTIGATSCAGWKLNSRQASAPMPCVTAWSLDQLQTAKIEIHCKGAQLLL